MLKYEGKDVDNVVDASDLSDFLAPDLDLDDPVDRAEYEDRLEDYFSKYSKLLSKNVPLIMNGTFLLSAKYNK